MERIHRRKNAPRLVYNVGIPLGEDFSSQILGHEIKSSALEARRQTFSF